MPNIFKYYYGSETLKEMLWRGMFIAHIFGIDMPSDISVCRLPENLQDMCGEQPYSDTRAALLVLFGAGFIDEKNFDYLFSVCQDYPDEINEVEKILIEQASKNNYDKYNSNLIQNVLMCVIYSKRLDNMQQITINEAISLYNSTYTFIKDGYIYLKDEEYIKILAEHGIGFGKIENKAITKVAEPKADNMLLDIRDFLCFIPVYKKPYYKEFLKYAKAQNIPYSNDLEEKYNQYVLKYKNTFKLKVYPRARHICHKYPNWFDYNLPENKSIRDLDIDITKSLVEGKEYDDDHLLDTAVGKAFTDREYDNDTVLEFRHGDEIIYFIVVASHKVERLDNEAFHKIPFDFNNIWTTITEWSRDKKIRKSVIDGQTEISVVPESEWEKIKPEDREYAKRLIIEQMQLHEEELKQNMFIQKLSDMKSNASNELKAKQEEAEKKAQEKEAEKNKHKLTFNQRKGGTGQ